MDDHANTGDYATLTITKHERPGFIDPETIPWNPWVMEGTHFRLMDVDVRSGGFTLFLKVDPGTEAPPHGHIGGVQGVILEGGFGYDDDVGKKGDYIREEPAAIHKPDSPNGCVMFAITHGPIVGYNPDGTIAAVVDAKMMYDMAVEAGAADHIEAHWT
ncbi:MAG: 2,4'-dihydroxyacetophenone dioxygenase family protein [Maritimibacter harenae]|jgi:anti-sigma factor ChrR (cupin superfamily)|uniref:ChrR-like cupin domain-containing protein n=1 Tax=Maritimibacter harenae TaxID=2606218 RepID=A0A845LYN5_9RHOB|nr:2,4'-dihydroxyacetophenone dioxygenase family protein [Maritimibacter harenae]MZR13130.1 hypothetical protein [Maritimibacter harenae]